MSSTRNNLRDLNAAINSMVRNIDSTLQASSNIWQQYYDQIASGQRILSEVNQETINLAETLGNLQSSLQDSLNATGESSKAAATGITILNSALEAGIGMLVEFIVGAAFTAIDNFIHRSERIQEAAETARASISDLKSSFEDLSSTVSDTKNRYAELAQGVDQITGKNLTLSSEDYEEFLSLGNQIADLFPSLTNHFNENGNAILNLTGNVNGIVGALNDLVAVEQQLTTKDMLEDFPNVYKGYVDNIKSYNENLNELERKKEYNEKLPDTYFTSINSVTGLTDANFVIKDESYNFQEVRDQILEALMEQGIYSIPQFAFVNDFDVDSGYPTIKIQNVSDSDLEVLDNFQEIINQHIQKLNDEIFYYENSLNDKAANFNSYLSTWLSDNWLYEKQNSGMQSAIQQQLFQSDWTSLAKADNVDIENFEETFNWLEQNYLKGISNLSDKDKINFSKLLNTDISAEEKVKLANELTSIFTEKGIKIPLDFVTDETKTGSTQDIINKFNDRNYGEENGFKYGNISGLDKFFEDNSIDSESEYKEWLKITEGINNATMAMVAYKTTKSEKEIELTSVEKAASVQSLSPGLNLLANVYSDVADGGNFDWSAILNNEEFKIIFGGMEESYDNFIETILNSPSDIKACQDAFNNLAASYLYNSDTLENLNEETASTIKNILTQQGYTNAATIVTDALAAKTDYLAIATDRAALSTNALDKATAEDINKLLSQSEQLDSTTQNIIAYWIAKNAANGLTMMTDGDLNNLSNLVQGIGGSISALKNYIYWKQKVSEQEALIEKQGENLNNTGVLDFYMNQMETSHKKAQSDINAALGKTSYNTNYSSDTPRTSNPSGNANSSAAAETTQTFNFIEIAVKRIESAIEQVKSKAENTFLSLTSRMDSYKQEIDSVTQEISIQQQAYDEYEKRYNQVGLEEEWAAKVRDGSIEIADVKDAGLKQRIQDYQTWYEKAQDCLKKIDELQNNLTQYKLNQLQISIDNAGSALKQLETSYDSIKNKMSLKESFGFTASAKDYTKLNSSLSSQMKNLSKQNSLLKQQQACVEKGSDSWNKYQEQIDSNNQSIQSLTASMIENAKANANLANAAAESKNDKLDKSEAVADEKLDVASSAIGKNRLVNTKISNVNKKTTNLKTAYQKSQSKLKSTGKKITNFKTKNLSKKNLGLYKTVQKQVKSGKRVAADTITKIQDALNNANGNEKTQLSNLLQYCIDWNTQLDAKEEARYNLQLQSVKGESEKAGLREQKLQNKLDSNQSTFDKLSTRAGTTAAEKNETLSSKIQQIKDNRTTYADNTKEATGNQEKTGETAKSDLSIKKNAGQKYKDAAKNAKTLINAGKKIDKKTLDTLKEYCKRYLKDNYTMLYSCQAYNSALEAQLTAEQEEVLYNAQSYGEEYAAKREKTQNTIEQRNTENDLFEAKKTNATTAQDKNALINKQISNLNNNLNTYNTDLSNANTDLKTAADKVTSTSTKGMSTAQQAIMSRIKKNYVDKRLTIPDNELSEAAKVSNAYQRACFDYNAALASKEQAQQTYDMYEQTAKTEKEALAIESVENVRNEHQTDLDTNQTKTDNYQAQIDKQTASGVAESKAQYEEQNNLSKERQKILENEKKAMEDTLNAQVAAGNIEKGSQAYKNMLNDISAIDAQITACVTDQIAFNTAISEMDLDNIKSLISLLNVLDAKLAGLASLAEAHGNRVSDSILTQQLESAFENLALFQQSLSKNEDLIREYAGVGGKWDLNLDSNQLDKFISLLESGDVSAVDNFLKQIGSSYGQLTGLQEIMSEIASDYSSIYDSMVKQEQIYDTLLQNRIGILNEVLDALNKINDQKERANALDKAKYNLERARNQRTTQILTQNGIVYQANQQDIKSAQEELSNAEFTELTNTIQDAIDAINELIKSNNIYDDDGNLTQKLTDVLNTVAGVDSDYLEYLERYLASKGYRITDITGFNTDNWVSSDNLVRVDNRDLAETWSDLTMPSNNLPVFYAQTPNYSNLSQSADTINTLQFYGDLSFPNIKSGDDVEKFVTELMNLKTYNMQYLSRK